MQQSHPYRLTVQEDAEVVGLVCAGTDTTCFSMMALRFPLTVQYRNPAEKKMPFHQLSYTHKGRSRSEYVRPENLAAVTREVETYRKFKTLVEAITELSLEASRLRHKRE